MNKSESKSGIGSTEHELLSPAKTARMIFRLIRACQPISRIELARRLAVNRSTVTDIVKPLITAGILREQAFPAADTSSQGRPPIALFFNDDRDFFIGVNLGVRHSQVGLATISGEILAEEEFETPSEPQRALKKVSESIEKLCVDVNGRTLRTIGVSVPGPTDVERRKLLYAPNLGWSDLMIADALQFGSVPVIVENDATAAAMYEARLKIGQAKNNALDDFILVRSGTGIGVGLVIDGEIYRGTGRGRGRAGEFGHMTIVAGGKPCACGNRGCWEKYASAASAASLYTGDRAVHANEKLPRFVEIVGRAAGGEIRAQKTLERIGEYLGIGIANVIMGIGMPHVIISGRLVYGWKFINQSLREAIKKSIVAKMHNWTIECGEPKGSALGGALEVAIEEFIANGLTV